MAHGNGDVDVQARRTDLPRLSQWALAAVFATSMAGCATTDRPYVFAEQGLTAPTGASAALTAASAPNLKTAIAHAREAQRQWGESARGESDRKRGVSAGLIGLSAIALLKGVTNPNARDLAGIGAVSAGLFAWGNTMTSSARNAIYREGIATLACAVESVVPYDSPNWSGSGDETIDKLLAKAQAAESKLDEWIDRLKPQNEVRTRNIPAQPLPANCAPLKQPVCTAAVPGSPQAAICEALKPKCAARAASTVDEKPDPSLSALMQVAVKEKGELTRTIDRTIQLQGRADSAGNWLWRTGVEVEQRVRDGIEKTEPDLATVLSVSQALKSPPVAAPAASAPSPAEAAKDAEAHSKRQPRQGDAVRAAPAGMDELQKSVDASQQARRAIDRRNRVLDAALSLARTENCRRVLPLSFDGAGTGAPAGNGTPAANTSAAPPVTGQPTGGGAPDTGVRTPPQTSG